MASEFLDTLVELRFISRESADLWATRLRMPDTEGRAPWDPWLGADWKTADRSTFDGIRDYYNSDPWVVYEALLFESWGGVNLDQELVALVRPGTRVLDFGCGSGRRGVGALKLGAEVTFCEIAPRLLAGIDVICRRRMPNAKWDLRPSAPRNQWEPQVFDLVLAPDVMEHLQDPSSTLADLVAATRTGGLLWMPVFFGGHELSPYHLPEHYHLGADANAGWNRICEAAGLARTGENLWQVTR